MPTEYRIDFIFFPLFPFVCRVRPTCVSNYSTPLTNSGFAGRAAVTGYLSRDIEQLTDLAPLGQFFASNGFLLLTYSFDFAPRRVRARLAT